MNFLQELSRIDADHPMREPGSPGAAAASEQIRNMLSQEKMQPDSLNAPVYFLQNGIGVLCILILFLLILGYVFPLGSCIGMIAALFLAIREFSHPLLSRFGATSATNIMVNLPAKNKETQRIFLVATFDSAPFIKTPFTLRPENYFRLVIGLLGIMTATEMICFLTKISWVNYGNFILLVILAVLTLLSRHCNQKTTALKNAAVLGEVGSILTKVKPDITTVTLFYCGSRSLHSGIIKLLPELAKGPAELTYLVNLTETDDPGAPTIHLITSEGPFGTKKPDSLLLSTIHDVAKEKAIPLQDIPTYSFTAAYPVDRKKINVLSIAIPVSDSVTLKQIRELLCGLIRKIDH